jgi:xylulokinase
MGFIEDRRNTDDRGLTQLCASETGPREWIRAVGLIPRPSHTVTSLRWLADHERVNAARTAAVCLPHDWLTSRLLASRGIGAFITDRSDVSGTGYWSAVTGQYRMDLHRALGHYAVVPQVLAPSEPAGVTAGGGVVGPGAADNAAVALDITAGPGDVIISIGTSGVVSAIANTPVAELHDRLADAGIGDPGAHRPTAAEHRQAGMRDRDIAAHERGEADRRAHWHTADTAP